MLTATQLKPDVWWVGGVDWNARSFHGYTTEDGITYNAYLIMDEKVTLIDTAKRTHTADLIERISTIVDPSKIDVLVSNHVEMDHSGSIPAIMELAPNATIYTSAPAGLNGLKAHYGDTYHYEGVKTGDTLCIGKRTLTFVQTPMVHWPDNMVTYDAYDKILFSNDAFGQHFASSAHFDDENDLDEIMVQAKKYYANIVQPYGPQAKRAVEAVKGIGVENLDLIAPAHGIIWRSNVADILAAYDKFVSGEVRDKAVVVYDSMWHSTEQMAKAVCEAFVEESIPSRIYDLKVDHPSNIMTDFLDAKYVCVGSPTLNSQMLPTVADFLTYMRGLSPKNAQRVGLAFGSYGWAPLGPNNVGKVLEECGFQLPEKTIIRNWVPDQAFLDEVQAKAKAMIESTR